MRKIFTLALLAFSLLSTAQPIDVLHYRHSIQLSDKTDTIYGTTFIRAVFKNQKGPAKFNLAGLTHGKGMQVDSAIAFARTIYHGQWKEFKDFLFTDGQIVIPILGVKHNDTISFYINYKGIPADGLIISKNKYSERTFFADNWPNRAHHWIPCIDRPDDKASFEFIVTAPSHYNVISNGLKIEEVEVGNGFKRTHWKEDIPSSTKVMVIGAARFATKTYENSPKDIPVSAWVYPQDSINGCYDFALAPDILKFFSDYIAPFPYKKLVNVQSTTIFGGMENASCIFYAEDLVTGDRSSEATVAHEIAHQWFGDMVSEKSFAHLWLSEGFATFLTNYYWEKKYGKEAAAKRWKQDRDKVIAFAKQNPRPVVDSTSDLMSLLNANSYQKGAWVLHMLRNEVGDSTFQSIIQTFYNQYKGGNAETRDFEAVAEKVSGKELTWFFDQWLYLPVVPQLEIRARMDSLDTFVVIVQKQPSLFRLKTTLGLRNIYNESHKIIPIVITKRETEIKLPSGHNKVYINPYQEILFDGKDEYTITSKSR